MNDYLLERRIAELEHVVKLLIEEVNKLKSKN